VRVAVQSPAIVSTVQSRHGRRTVHRAPSFSGTGGAKSYPHCWNEGGVWGEVGYSLHYMKRRWSRLNFFYIYDVIFY
jgi:hypothetical protein